ncbi:hypothetical protein D9M71_805640 [compost metagenome]
MRKRNVSDESIFDFFINRFKHRRAEQTWGNSHYPNAISCELPGRREGQGHHTSFGCGVSTLADLAFVGSNRGGIDDDAACAVSVGDVVFHGIRRQT